MITPATTRVTLPYGAYGEAGYTKDNPHAGVDFSWQNDTNIYAPEDATVTRVGYLGTAGESIDLVAGNNKHRMCHLSRYLVSAGQTVRQGQVIGIMGETGQAYGVHLHWVLWVNGVRVNGMNYVTKGDEMITKDDVGLLRIGHSEIGGWDLNKTHAGEYDGLFLGAWQGKPVKDFIWAQWTAGAPYRDAKEALKRRVAELEAVVGGSKAEVATAQKAVAEANSKLEKETVKATEAGKKAAELEAQRRADEEAGSNFIRRIGQFISKYLPGASK